MAVLCLNQYDAARMSLQESAHILRRYTGSCILGTVAQNLSGSEHDANTSRGSGLVVVRVQVYSQYRRGDSKRVKERNFGYQVLTKASCLVWALQMCEMHVQLNEEGRRCGPSRHLHSTRHVQLCPSPAIADNLTPAAAHEYKAFPVCLRVLEHNAAVEELVHQSRRHASSSVATPAQSAARKTGLSHSHELLKRPISRKTRTLAVGNVASIPEILDSCPFHQQTPPRLI